MNQFPILIEYLLLNHDYVVIPGLGTFIVQQMNAKRNEAEEAFLPPIRSVRFNVELVHSDDLILNAIQEIYKISLLQAEQLLGTWIEDFQQALEDNECLEFGALGVFSKEGRNTLLFTPQEAGVTTPEYYGLDAFHMNTVQAEPKAEVIPLTASMEANDETIIIRINRRIANMVAAACAIILLFVFVNNPMPILDTADQQSSIKEMLLPSKTSSQPVTIKAETAEVTINKEPKVVQQETTTPNEEVIVETQPAVDEYTIVMASAISQKNAESFVNKLNADGFESARVIITGKMVRVVVGHYATEQEAYTAAHAIHQRSTKYRSAWVHRLSL